MARPERHDVDYFPFIAKRGKTLNILQSRYGLEGIGFFTNLLRFLALTPDHHYCIKEELDMLNFFAEIGLPDAEKGLAMIELMVKTEKLDRDLWENHKVIACPAFLEGVKHAYERRSNPIITLEEIRAKFQDTTSGVIVSENTGNATASGVIVSENTGNATASGVIVSKTTTETPQSGVFNDNNPQTKLKESKEKETKNSCGSSEPPTPATFPDLETVQPPDETPPDKNPGKPKKPSLREREPENDQERVVKAYLENWDSLHRQGIVKTVDPVLNIVQVGSLIKGLCKNQKLDIGQIIAVVNKSVSEPFVLQNGFSLGQVLSRHNVNKQLNGSTGPPSKHRHRIASDDVSGDDWEKRFARDDRDGFLEEDG